MTAFFLILTFPLIAGLGFGMVYAVRRLSRGIPPAMGGREGLIIYAALLLLPLLVTLFTLPTPDVSFAEVGVRWPAGLPPLMGAAVSLVLGGAVGTLAYLGEKRLLSVVHGACPVRREKTPIQYLTDGQTADAPHGSTRVHKAHGASALLLVVLTALAVAAEEVLWRGYLLAFMQEEFALSWGGALLIAAAAFGSNHFYFGLRNVGAKFVLGLLWGGLFLATSSLLASLASHLTFNALALEIRIQRDEA